MRSQPHCLLHERQILHEGEEQGNFKKVDLGSNIHLKRTGCSEEFLFTSTPHRRLGLNVAEACVSLLSDCIKCCCEPCLPFTFEEALQVRSASLKAINEKWVEVWWNTGLNVRTGL